MNAEENQKSIKSNQIKSPNPIRITTTRTTTEYLTRSKSVFFILETKQIIMQLQVVTLLIVCITDQCYKYIDPT